MELYRLTVEDQREILRLRNAVDARMRKAEARLTKEIKLVKRKIALERRRIRKLEAMACHLGVYTKGARMSKPRHKARQPRESGAS
jgi:hypothetical protein